jgi:hypothetical protein
MDIVTQEATAWLRAADVAGVELTADVIKARDHLTAVEEQRAGLGERPTVPTAASLVANGVPLDEAPARFSG